MTCCMKSESLPTNENQKGLMLDSISVYEYVAVQTIVNYQQHYCSLSIGLHEDSVKNQEFQTWKRPAQMPPIRIKEA